MLTFQQAKAAIESALTHHDPDRASADGHDVDAILAEVIYLTGDRDVSALPAEQFARIARVHTRPTRAEARRALIADLQQRFGVADACARWTVDSLLESIRLQQGHYDHRVLFDDDPDTFHALTERSLMTAPNPVRANTQSCSSTCAPGIASAPPPPTSA